MLGESSPGQLSAWSVHHQYSVSVSPFQANTGTPRGSSGVPSGPTATAAAAWSWVEKMLQLAHRTCAPRATSVSIRTAVCTVMCSEPVMRAPRSGCASAYSARIAMRPGISCSARVISLRPNSASDRSATLKCMPLRLRDSTYGAGKPLLELVDRGYRCRVESLCQREVDTGVVDAPDQRCEPLERRVPLRPKPGDGHAARLRN